MNTEIYLRKFFFLADLMIIVQFSRGKFEELFFIAVNVGVFPWMGIYIW
jgi:hypothetical protein